MQSSSTKLLQTATWAKLQSWLKYINGRDNNYWYRLTKELDKFTIWQSVPDAPNWQFRILTLGFNNDLELSATKKKSGVVLIAYSDPEFYRKLFAVIDDVSKNSGNCLQGTYKLQKEDSDMGG